MTVMSEFFRSIQQGLNEAIDYCEDNCSQAVVHEVLPAHKVSPVDVKNIRAKLAVSQAELASVAKVSVRTVQYWESGQHIPRKEAREFLVAVEEEPQLFTSLAV